MIVEILAVFISCYMVKVVKEDRFKVQNDLEIFEQSDEEELPTDADDYYRRATLSFNPPTHRGGE